jgi:hypothetical protein
MKYSPTAFVAALRSPAGLPKATIAVEGAVKEHADEPQEALLFSPGRVCAEWIRVPLDLIESIEDVGKVRCDGHLHHYVRLHLKTPDAPDARLFSDLLGAHLDFGPGTAAAKSNFDMEFLDADAEPVFRASAISESVCQAIVYGETGTLQVGSEAELPMFAEARRFIAGVAYKRDGSGVAKPKYPTAEELKQPFIKRAWDRCLVAAKAAAGDDVGAAKHFVIWFSDDGGNTPSKKPREITDKWPYTETDKITKHWGPFKDNSLGGSNIYVIQYTGVA